MTTLVLPEGVEATRLTRADGVDMARVRSGKWLVRCTLGPTWFWSPSISDWVISIGLSLEDMSRLCEMPYGEALSALQTVEKKKREVGA